MFFPNPNNLIPGLKFPPTQRHVVWISHGLMITRTDTLQIPVSYVIWIEMIKLSNILREPFRYTPVICVIEDQIY